MNKKINKQRVKILLKEIQGISSFQIEQLDNKKAVNKELFLRSATEFIKSYCEEILKEIG